jgi:hypothetical protein
VQTHAKRLGAAAMLAIIVTLMFGASSAYAVGTGSVSKNLNISNLERIRVSWQSTTPGVDLVISQCNGKGPLDPSFNLNLDCGAGTIRNLNYNTTGTGNTGTTCANPAVGCATGANPDPRIFVNVDFSELGWECGPASTPAADPADTKYSTCYIRVTEGQQSNLDADFFIPITWDDVEEPEPVVPEAPYAVLLPAGAVAVAAAAYFVLRNRRPAIAA